MICNNCGKENGEDWKFCKYCGAKANEPVKRACTKCGAELDEDSIFCSKCGTKVDGTASQPVLPEKKYICPNCSTEFGADKVFCDKCGHKLEEKTTAVHPTQSGRMIAEFKLMSRYKGETIVADGSGTLVFYDDRVEYLRKFNNLFGGFVLVDRTPVVIRYSDLKSYYKGTKMGFTSITFVHKNGESETYSGTLGFDSEKLRIVMETLKNNVKL